MDVDVLGAAAGAAGLESSKVVSECVYLQNEIKGNERNEIQSHTHTHRKKI